MKNVGRNRVKNVLQYSELRLAHIFANVHICIYIVIFKYADFRHNQYTVESKYEWFRLKIMSISWNSCSYDSLLQNVSENLSSFHCILTIKIEQDILDLLYFYEKWKNSPIFYFFTNKGLKATNLWHCESLHQPMSLWVTAPTYVTVSFCTNLCHCESLHQPLSLWVTAPTYVTICHC